MLFFEEFWHDFPCRVSVLLVAGDQEFRREVQARLERYSYIVTSFAAEDEAYAALSSLTGGFHVALVETTSDKPENGPRILEFSKHLPIIMMSAMENLAMMLRSLALGAVEFWVEPLLEDKLKNIWQHVIRKALESRNDLLPGYMEPGKLQSDFVEQDGNLIKLEYSLEGSSGSVHDASPTWRSQALSRPMHERPSSPSTPQFDHIGRDAFVEVPLDESPRSHDSSQPNNFKIFAGEGSNLERTSVVGTGHEVKEEPKGDTKENRRCMSKKKCKVGWTADLHRRFVQAVEYLGVDQAIPSKILEVMKVDGLTRHNIASHLQKYRSRHRKHLLKRDVEANNWHLNQVLGGKGRALLKSYPGNISQFQPCWKVPTYTVHLGSPMAYPQPLICPPLHVWGQPIFEHPPMNAFQACNVPIWQYPMIPSGFTLETGMMPSAIVSTEWDSKDEGESGHIELLDYPPKELLDAAIREVLSKPHMPLPIGLKPPSMESVMAELQRQGGSMLSPLPKSN